MSNAEPSLAIRVVGLNKSFGDVPVLRGISFDLNRGQVLSIIGASGSGKSTLLRCLNYLERPTSGDVWIAGYPLTFATDRNGSRRNPTAARIARVRAEVGMVFGGYGPCYDRRAECDGSANSRYASFRLKKHAVVRSIILPSQHARRCRALSFAVVGRAATAGRHRPRSLDGAADHALR